MRLTLQSLRRRTIAAYGGAVCAAGRRSGALRATLVALLPALLAALANEGAAHAVQVRVLGANGEPAADVQVRVYIPPASASILELRREAISEARTGAAGTLDLSLPALSKVVLVLDEPAHAPLITEVAPEADAPLVYRLTSPTSLRGSVLSLPSPEAWAGTACARWTLPIPSLGRPYPFERCAALQPSGSFDLPGVAQGAIGELTVRAEGFLPQRLRLPADLLQPLHLQRGELVEGVVLGPSDRPVAGAVIRNPSGGETRSGEEGRFALRFPALPAKLIVLAAGFRRAEAPVGARPAGAPPPSPMKIVLSPGPTLEGRVLGAEGKPLERVSVRLLRETPSAEWRAENLDVELAGEGDLRLDLPQPGRYRFELRAQGLRPFRSDHFTVLPGQGVSLGVVTLPAGGGVEGRVVDAQSGSPLSGVLVSLWPQGLSGSRRLASHLLGQAVSDREGRYRIAGQDEGAYELRFERRPLASTYREVVLGADSVVALTDEAMGSGVGIHGRVRTLSGTPKAGVAVRFLARNGASRIAIAEALTDAGGRFEGLRLAPASYRVEVRGDRVLLAQTIQIDSSSAEDPEGLDLRTAETSLSGVVLRRGRPLAGGLLSAGAANLIDPRLGKLVLETPAGGREVLGGPESGSALSQVDEEGIFHFDDLPPGHLLLTYTSPEGQTWTRAVDLAPTGESFLRLELGGKGLAGVVVDGRSGEPIEGVAITVRDGLGQPLGSLVGGPEGTFVLADLASDVVRVEASKPGFRTAVLERRLTEEGPPLRLELEPAEAGSLAVRLQQPSGQPLAFTFVTVLTASGAMARSLPLDAEGEKRFENLPAGSYRVAWSDPVTGLGVSVPLAVPAGDEVDFEQVVQEPAQLELACPPEACGGRPLEGLSLYSQTPVDLSALLTGFAPGLAFSADGRLRLGALQPGFYELNVQLGGRVSHFQIQALSGQRLTVPLNQRSASLAP